MQTKPIQLPDGVWINIPVGLSPEQEVQLIAELDPAALEAECKEVMRQHEAGELLAFDVVLAQLLNEAPDNGQPT